MNLPNRITLARFAVALVAFALLIMIDEGRVDGHGTIAWIALGFFILSTATDFLDGYVARRYDLVTAFGRLADPFVDKAVVCGCLILLCSIPASADILRPWMVILIVSREFLVNGIRGYCESLGIDFGADMPGKIKMVVQSFAVGYLIGVVATAPDTPSWILWPTYALVWSSVVLTVWSGMLYVIKAKRVLGPKAGAELDQ